MATLTERLAKISAEEEAVKKDNPVSTIYPVRSGTKDIHASWQIGGKALYMKKVARQPLQIYKGREFLHNINILRGTVTQRLNKISLVPKIRNDDTKPGMDTIVVTKVIGMEKMGGTGVPYAEATIEKHEEMKLIKMNYLAKDV